VDVNLPGSIDGAELAARVRAQRPELPTGRYSADDIAPLVARSVFVPKPYNPANVCSLLARLTGG
jgi:hypothetical protein